MSDYFLADDLSGALDAAAAFHHAGYRVRVPLQPDDWRSCAPGEVVAITTETRNASASDAAATVRQVMEKAQTLGARLRYKKVDSTLRGPIAAELKAIMDALPEARVLFAPANPAVGRTVRDGVLLVNGVPVADTPFGQDPGSPLRTSNVREILGPVATARVNIPDTSTSADLVSAVTAMKAALGPWIGVGSGALAVVVARTDADTAVPPFAAALPRVAASPVLMVGGSAHPLNRRQIETLRLGNEIAVHELSFEQPHAAGASAAAALRTGHGVILHVPVPRATRTAAVEAMADAALVAIQEGGARRFFMTGGETAFAICRRLGVEALVFAREIEPGLSLSVGESKLGPLLIAVKPGGFGDEQTWVRAWEALQAEGDTSGSSVDTNE